MTTLIHRSNKIIIGSALILAAMQWNSTLTGLAVLSLIAIPIIFSGMYDWRPLEYIISRLAKLSKFSTPIWKSSIGRI